MSNVKVFGFVYLWEFTYSKVPHLSLSLSPYSILQLGAAVHFDITGHYSDFLDFDWHSKLHHVHMKLALWSIAKS